MQTERSPFLDGALAWLYTEGIPDRCERCDYDWSTDAGVALQAIATSPRRYAALLDGRDGTAPGPDGGWNADATRWLAHEYLHHELDVDERASPR